VKNPFGGFKHNYQALRVLSHLEEEYIDFWGLDLSYQTMEGIWKHTKINNKNCTACKIDNCSKCYDISEYINFEVDMLHPQFTFSSTLEGQIVAISDEIAQRGHDLDDALSANIITEKDIDRYIEMKKATHLNKRVNEINLCFERAKSQNRTFINESELKQSRIVSEIIHYFINDVIENSNMEIEKYKLDDFTKNGNRLTKKLIKFSDDGKELCDYLERIISNKVIGSTDVTYFDNKASLMISELFRAYYNNPRLLHEGTLRRITLDFRKIGTNVISFIDGDTNLIRNEWNKIINTDIKDVSALSNPELNEYWLKRKILVRNIADFISGMTDSYAVNEYKKIYL
jgi:dGTPase